MTRNPVPAPPPTKTPSGPLALISGEDDFAVKQRARQLYQQWCAEVGGLDHEIIDASVGNSGEALKVLARLREAMQTLPFFGSAKVIWLQNCNFLGDERFATAQAVTAAVNELAQELKTFRWNDVRLLISAGKVDKRKTFYKTVEKLGLVENLAALSLEDKGWADQAGRFVELELGKRKKRISAQALGELVESVGPQLRQLSNEVEKLALYLGERDEVTLGDVTALVTRQKHARAFALGDALGDRDLPRLLRTLEEELWELKSDRQKSVIGLLYGLITKVRVLLLLKEMLRAGWLKADSDYNRFKAQLERLPAAGLPEDKRYNPTAINPYVLFKALPQARHYTTEELVRAMDQLLVCNQRLVSSSLDEALVLQQTLVQIVSRPGSNPAPVPRGG